VDGHAAHLRPAPARRRACRRRAPGSRRPRPTAGGAPRSGRGARRRAPASGSRRTPPRVTEACAELAALGIPATIDHSDLHDAQVFVDPAGDRFFDWGDAGWPIPS
jgi:hypothetical protein